MNAFDEVAMNTYTVFKALSHLLHLDFYRDTRPETIIERSEQNMHVMHAKAASTPLLHEAPREP